MGGQVVLAVVVSSEAMTSMLSARWSARPSQTKPMMPQITPIDGGEQGRGGEVGAVAVVVVETIGFDVFLSGQEAGRELGQMRYAVPVFGGSADLYYFGIGFPEVGHKVSGQDEGAQNGGHENKDQEAVGDDGVA